MQKTPKPFYLFYNLENDLQLELGEEQNFQKPEKALVFIKFQSQNQNLESKQRQRKSRIVGFQRKKKNKKGNTNNNKEEGEERESCGV